MSTMAATLSAPPPVLPPRSSLRTTDSHRRRSLPAPSGISSSRRSANHVTVKPASPAVISSLISTLSAISPPIGSQFDDLPRSYAAYSTPASPLSHQSEFPLVIGPGGKVSRADPVLTSAMKFGMDYETHHPPWNLKENSYLSPDDAAAFPTVLRGPRRFPSSSTLRTRQSRQDIGNRHPLEQKSSIGNLSIEPGPRISAASLASTGSGGRKSLKSFRSLKSSGSKESMRKETAKRTNKNLFPEPANTSENGSHKLGVDESGSAYHHSPVIFEDKDVISETLPIPSRSSSTGISATQRVIGPHPHEPKGSPGPASSPRRIPTRDSSLRRSHGGSSTNQKRKSYRSDHSGAQEREKSSFEQKRVSSQTSHTVFDEAAEDEVSRRIRQLKDQKKQRETPLTIATTNSDVDSNTVDFFTTPSPVPPVEALISDALEDLQKSQPSAAAMLNNDESVELSAPSPAILQRINRNKPTPSRSTATKTVPLIKYHTDPNSIEGPLPARSDSRLMKRVSRPTSPIKPEKHKKSLSGNVLDDRPNSSDSVDSAVEGYIACPRLSQKITHPQTGRVISFSEVGDPDGSVIFCCVGMGLTRYITAFYDDLARTLKLRLITPDRPGVGGSEPHIDGSDTPLGWPDDILAICQHLKLTKFSIMAHSAGAIYALATALRMPQHIRGRIHLLAPWIPPSQMSAFGSQQEALPAGALPYSQRFLRSLPTPFLRAANSSFLSATSASITTSLPKSPRRLKRRSLNLEPFTNGNGKRDHSSSPKSAESGYTEASISKEAALSGSRVGSRIDEELSTRMADKERQSNYDNRLTEAIWESATKDANPAVDLLICLERRQPIGFRYVDITRSVVIHHGSKDNRVPVENVKWLGKMMRRCEVRVMEGEGHGLMASAAVMGGVLMEMAKEWEDWIRLVKGKGGTERRKL